MSLSVAQLGQPVLRTVAQEIEPESIDDPAFQIFIDQMIETMKSSRGVGLAAPQVFASRRLFIADVLPPAQRGERPRTEVFINPKLSDLSEEREAAWEGCLSFIELLVLVPRHRGLRVDYLNRKGKQASLILSGFPARVVQHEYDHLDGVLTIDRATSTRNIIKASEIDAVEDHPDGRDSD